MSIRTVGKPTGRRVAIVGAALSDCGKVDDKTVYQLHHQATARALADAGLTHQDVDGFMSTTTGALPPIELAEYLGLHPRWVDGTNVGGSVWEFMVEHAAAAISSGYVDVVVLTYGSTTRADLKRKLRTADFTFGGRGPGNSPSPTVTRSSPVTPWRPCATCTSTAPPWSSWPRSPCPPGTTPRSTRTPPTGS